MASGGDRNGLRGGTAAQGERARHAAARGPEERADQRRASRAHQAADADDLPLAHLERDVAQHLAPGHQRILDRPVLDLQQGHARLVGRARVERPHLAAHHHRDHLVRRQLLARGAPHGAAVAQHGDAVRDLEDLLQAMADVDARHAARAQLAEEAVEAGGVRLREGRRRLVEDEDARLLGQRLADLHELLLADAQLLDGAPGVDVEADHLQRGLRLLAHEVPADEPGPHRLAAEGEVLLHGQLGDEGQLLRDEGDAVVLGVPEALEAHRCAVEQDLAAVGARRD